MTPSIHTPPPSTVPVPGWGQIAEASWTAIRGRLARRPVLLAGPYVGEFGHELIDWQGYVRTLRPLYREVHVITFPGREYLYEGCRVHTHDLKLETAGYFYGSMSYRDMEAYSRERAAALGLEPCDRFHTGYLCTRVHRRLLWRQTFLKFAEEPWPGGPYDVAFHFRAINKLGPDQSKNYDPARAARLVSMCVESGLRVCCVGHPSYALCPDGADDRRGPDMRDAVRSFSSARVACGELSGPMHLAMLCGKPIVTWVPGAWRMTGAHKRNPFRVPVHVVTTETTQAEPGEVRDMLKRVLT